MLLCGYAGLEGSLRILEAAEEELSQRFINTFLMQAKKLRDQLITPEQILEAAKGRDISVWQIGSGGILAALWEMAEEEKIGFEIAMGSISLKQETVEICEYYRLNPYQLTSAGSYLILTDEADQVIEVHSAGNGNKTVYLSADGGKAFLRRGREPSGLGLPKRRMRG